MGSIVNLHSTTPYTELTTLNMDTILFYAFGKEEYAYVHNIGFSFAKLIIYTITYL